MPRFIEGQDRQQVTLLPESLDEFIAEDNAVQVVDAFVNGLDLSKAEGLVRLWMFEPAVRYISDTYSSPPIFG